MYGCMPGTNVDRNIMERTYLKLQKRLRNPYNVWGCDFPMFAMCAVRLGRPREAIDSLLQEDSRNVYLPNGHMMQRPDLPVYLPANGGLLWAVALMAAGWEGGPADPAPGFPRDGSWTVRHEGLHAAI
jgi:protein-glucosylgalactosylhydroxylysine glucosidase